MACAYYPVLLIFRPHRFRWRWSFLYVHRRFWIHRCRGSINACTLGYHIRHKVRTQKLAHPLVRLAPKLLLGLGPRVWTCRWDEHPSGMHDQDYVLERFGNRLVLELGRSQLIGWRARGNALGNALTNCLDPVRMKRSMTSTILKNTSRSLSGFSDRGIKY